MTFKNGLRQKKKSFCEFRRFSTLQDELFAFSIFLQLGAVNKSRYLLKNGLTGEEVFYDFPKSFETILTRV